MKIKQQYKKSWKFLKQSKNYIWFSAVVFILFALIGFVFPVFFQEQILNLIHGMIAELEGLSTFNLIIYIFFNNLKASFFAVILGILIGILPLITLIFNGYLLGFVARNVVAEEGVLVLWRILPHGIFELPAVIISIAFGLKIGHDVLHKKLRKNLKSDFWEALRTFVFIIIPLLIVAAIVEGVLVNFLG